LSDTEKIIYEEWKITIAEELGKAELQRDIRKAVIEGPAEYKERVESQETSADVVEKRMLTESPILKQEKLKYDGDNIIPDFDAHEKARRKREFHKW
tara:strand:+ start:264 stop:554 length:291 start_codon:yes stop_codon:yes gene_type:complete